MIAVREAPTDPPVALANSLVAAAKASPAE
jgi:hypothetical protein